jgi:chromosome segregation ATPase
MDAAVAGSNVAAAGCGKVTTPLALADTSTAVGATNATKLCDALGNLTTPPNNVEERLRSVAREVSAVQRRLQDKEDALLNGGKYADAIRRHRDARDKLDSLRTEHTALAPEVARQTEELAELTDRLGATKKSIKEKGRRMTDATPLVRIKTATQAVRGEIQDMDARIGILAHLLLQSQLAVAQRTRKLQHQQHQQGDCHYDGIDSDSDSDDDGELDDDGVGQ